MSIGKALGILVFVIAISTVGYLAYWNYQFSHRTFGVKQTIKVYPHTHLNTLAHKLQQYHLWQHPYIFVLLARYHGFAGDLRFGDYKVSPAMTPLILLDNIHHARGIVTHRFRIHEGWTLKNLVAALHQNSNIQFKALSQIPQQLEGMVYPDTYKFAWGVTSNTVIHYGVVEMQRILQQAWKTRDQSIPIKSPYQALIVASLIQTEAASIAERPKIAAVIYNRLRKHMRLQIDPTVMYGLGLPYGSILTKHQLEQRTPYNTYTFAGLPPTPIAFPTRSSIEAAVHPAELSAYYYVAKGDGTHTFSNSYRLHKKAVAQYRAFLNEQKWQLQKQALEVIMEEGL